MSERVRLVRGRIAVDPCLGKARESGARAIAERGQRMNSRRRVLLVDDHTMLLAAFERLLSPAFEVVGTIH